MTSGWRDRARPIIQRVLRETSEIARQRGQKRASSVGETDPDQLSLEVDGD